MEIDKLLASKFLHPHDTFNWNHYSLLPNVSFSFDPIYKANYARYKPHEAN